MDRRPPELESGRRAAILAYGEALPAARLYASGTGRRVRELDGPRGWVSPLERCGPEGAFLWLPERDFDYACAERLTETSARGVSLGIMPVGQGSGLGDTTAIRLANRRRRRPAFLHHVLQWPDPDADEPARFLAQLREGAHAAVLSAHGNGVDFRLSKDTVLCAQADHLAPGPALPQEHFLPCHVGGVCYRERLGFRRRIGASAVRAELVVLAACHGILPSDGWLSGRLNFCYALFRGLVVCAVVTTIRAVAYPEGSVAKIVTALGQGIPGGALASTLNRSLVPGGFLCLGDPDLRVPPAKTAGASVRSSVPPAVDSTVLANLLTADLVGATASHGPRLKEERARRRACAVAMNPETSGPSDPLVPADTDWTGIADLLGRRSEACRRCGRPGETWRYRSRLYPCHFEVSGCERHRRLRLLAVLRDVTPPAPELPRRRLACAWVIRSARASSLCNELRPPRQFDRWQLLARRLEESALRSLRHGVSDAPDEYDGEMAQFLAWAAGTAGMGVQHTPHKDWRTTEPSPLRHGCGSAVWRRTYLWMPFGFERATLDCSRCGLFADGPCHSGMPSLRTSPGVAVVDLSAIPRRSSAWVSAGIEPWVHSLAGPPPRRLEPNESIVDFRHLPQAPDGSVTKKIASIVANGELWFAIDVSSAATRLPQITSFSSP